MKQKIFLFISFGCLGITTEIFFTSIMDFIFKINEGVNLDYKFEGKSYIWMFFIYGLGSVIFPIIYNKVKSINLILRLLIYSLIIFLIEFISGFILDKLTGNCPWEYKSGLAICGYIRLDYVFFWMGFGFLLELIYNYLMNICTNGLKK